MSTIHPLANVDPEAELGSGVTVGPFCHIAAAVVLGDGCELHDHVTLLGPSEFGRQNTFHPMCVLGTDPQDLKYKGGPTVLRVGDDNTFREFVSVHRGTEVGRGKVYGDSTAVRGVNSIGMSRWGIDETSITAVKEAFRLLYGKRSEQWPGRTSGALREIEANGVFGRAREAARRDRDRDREQFYEAADRNGTA